MAIIRGLVVVAFFGLIAKLAGAAKEIAIAAKFGISPIVDGYLFAFNLLNAPISIWYGAIFAILVPQFIRMSGDDPRELALFRGEFAAFTMLVGLAFGLAGAAGIYGLLAGGLSGLDEQTTQISKHAVSLMWPIVPLLFVTHYGSTMLIAARIHINSVYEGIPAVLVLAFILAWPASTLLPIALGTVLGCMIQLFMTAYSLNRHARLNRPVLSRTSEAWAAIVPMLGTMVAAQGLQSLSPIVDQFIAARLNPGSLATLGYAGRVFGIALTLVALAVPRVMLPVFSDLRRDDPQRLTHVALRWTLGFLVTGVALSTTITFLSPAIVRLMFERGAFDGAATERVAAILTILGWQLPFYLAALVLTQLSFTQGAYRNLVVLGIGTVFTKLVAGLFLSRYFGLEGLAVSVCLVFVFQTIYLMIALLRAKPEISLENSAT